MQNKPGEIAIEVTNPKSEMTKDRYPGRYLADRHQNAAD